MATEEGGVLDGGDRLAVDLGGNRKLAGDRLHAIGDDHLIVNDIVVQTLGGDGVGRRHADGQSQSQQRQHE